MDSVSTKEQGSGASPPRRGRPINQDDVWEAADALLLEGARPTIERVRQKIGRGSPNTVSPYLDTWFCSLGARIKDPLAFSRPPAAPDPVQQLAQHLWETSLATARQEVEERQRDESRALEEARAALELERSALKEERRHIEAHLQARDEAMALARAQAEDARQRLAALDTRLHDQVRELAAVREREAEALRELAQLRRQLEAERCQHEEQRTTLEERAAARERHWTLEVERAREALKSAEQQATRRLRDATHRAERLESDSHAFQKARDEWEERCRIAGAERDRLQAELDATRSHLGTTAAQQAELQKQLERVQDQLAQALRQLETKDREHGALLQALVDQRARKPPKPRQTHSG